ncbi:MAG: hypothetical protein RXQ00_08405 [Caldivirga sp.]
MAECQPKIPEVNYRNEDWWREFFIKPFTEFYSTVSGFIHARRGLLGSLSNLQQAFNDPKYGALALEVLLGGVNPDCVAKASVDEECIPGNSMAGFYRRILGIGLDLDSLNRLLNTYRYYAAGGQGYDYNALSKASSGIGVKELESRVMNIVNELYSTVSSILSTANINPPEPKRYAVNGARDLVDAFIEVYNSGMKLLPLYNKVTFFTQSLIAPKPYLKLMYCDDIFNGSVNLMYRYGFRLSDILTPGLNEELNREWAIVGHKKGSTGDLIMKLLSSLYQLNIELVKSEIFNVDNELMKYISNYRQYLDVLLTKLGLKPEDVYWIEVSSSNGKVKLEIMDRDVRSERRIVVDYFEFVTDFSPSLFLGLLDFALSSSLEIRTMEMSTFAQGVTLRLYVPWVI